MILIFNIKKLDWILIIERNRNTFLSPNIPLNSLKFAAKALGIGKESVGKLVGYIV